MERTQLRRKPQRGSHDRAVIHAIVDEALVCHVAVSTDHGPLVIPTTHVRIGETLYVHGAARNGLLDRLGDGAPACIAITLLDGLVLARTALHHSVNYRSVVVFARGARVADPAEKRAVLAALLDKVEPGRSGACRAPNDKELGATQIIAVALAEASAKVRSGPPLADEGDDARLPYWAGVIPLVTSRGTPKPA